MKLSVIMPCLNAEATLPVQLEALAMQRWSESWELIVSDNGSTDNSVQVALTYKNRFSAFRVIDASTRRTSFHARNVGVRVASAENLAFCDADDEVQPGWIASIGDALCKYDVVHGQNLFDKLNDAHQAELTALKWKDGLYKRRFLPAGATCNLGIQRWVHEAINGFDECLPRFGDADYFWRLQLEGFRLHYVPEAIVQYRIARVDPSLFYLFWRGRTAAAAHYWLYKRYRHFGMQPLNPLKNSLFAWLRILVGGAKLSGMLNEERRYEWIKSLFINSGNLVGQLQGRITNPCKPYRSSKIDRECDHENDHQRCD